MIDFGSFSWIIFHHFLPSPCNLARYDTFQSFSRFYIISQTSLSPKTRKTTCNNGSKLPRKCGNFDRWSMLPHAPIKVTPKHIQEVRFRKILSKVSLKFVFLSIKFAFNFFIYLLLVYRPLLTYSKATVGTLEQS